MGNVNSFTQPSDVSIIIADRKLFESELKGLNQKKIEAEAKELLDRTDKIFTKQFYRTNLEKFSQMGCVQTSVVIGGIYEYTDEVYALVNQEMHKSRPGWEIRPDTGHGFLNICMTSQMLASMHNLLKREAFD